MTNNYELTDAEKRLFKWHNTNVFVNKIVRYQTEKNGIVHGITSVKYVSDDEQGLYFTHPYLTAKDSPNLENPCVDHWTVDMDNFGYRVDPELMDILKDLIEEFKECDKKLREEYAKNGAD